MTTAAPPEPAVLPAIVRDAMDKPVDLAANLKRMQTNAATVLRFVAQHLVEAEYDDKGYLIPGKLHDYYQIPGTTNKALTKKGAENLALLFRYAKGSTTVASQIETPDYCSATVNVTLMDHFSRPVGSAAGSCSTAEAGFQGFRARRKYGAQSKKQGNEYVETRPPDMRAALNDVVARAGKRAFVQALIVATATDEVFQLTDDAREAVATSTAPAVAVLPFKTKKYVKGTPLTKLGEADLKELHRWCSDRAEWAQLKEDCTEALEVLRTEGPDAADLAGLAL